MAEYKKREVAHKLKIGDILAGVPIVESIPQDLPDPNETMTGATTKERFRFLELGDRKIVRVNVVANIVDKYNSEGEKKFATLTIDDASGQIRLKFFGEDVEKFSELTHGDTVIVIGVLRSYNQEVYISPEIMKKTDPRYLLVRKLELEGKKSEQKPAITGEKKAGVREEIIDIIKGGEEAGGVSTEDIILKVKSADPATINSEIIKLIEDGMAYEPRPGKIRWLG